MAENKAFWECRSHVSCPHCGNYFDADSHMTDKEKMIDPGEAGTKGTKNVFVTCPWCKSDFLVDFEK